METINKLFSALEAEISSKNNETNNYAKPSGLKMIVYAAFLAILVVFIIFTKWWVWLLYLLTLAVLAYINSCDNHCSVDYSGINEILTNLRKEISKKEDIIKTDADKIDALNKKIKEVEELLEEEKNSTPNIDKLLKSPYIVLLEEMQTLNSETVDFGEEMQKYLSERIAKSLLRCGLRFEDYSDEYADCYEIDIDPKITELEYMKKAVMDNQTNHVVLKGKVFLPEKRE